MCFLIVGIILFILVTLWMAFTVFAMLYIGGAPPTTFVILAINVVMSIALGRALLIEGKEIIADRRREALLKELYEKREF